MMRLTEPDWTQHVNDMPDPSKEKPVTKALRKAQKAWLKKYKHVLDPRVNEIVSSGIDIDDVRFMTSELLKYPEVKAAFDESHKTTCRIFKEHGIKYP